MSLYDELAVVASTHLQGAVRVNALTVLDAGFEGKKRSKKRCSFDEHAEQIQLH